MREIKLRDINKQKSFSGIIAKPLRIKPMKVSGKKDNHLLKNKVNLGTSVEKFSVNKSFDYGNKSLHNNDFSLVKKQQSLVEKEKTYADSLSEQPVWQEVNGFGKFIDRPRTNVIERGDAPFCSINQRNKYEKHWNDIVPNKVIEQARRSGDIIHGSYSVNMQVPKDLQRPSNDIDVWTEKQRERAIEMENELDECMGCDIAYVKETKISKKSPLERNVGVFDKPSEGVVDGKKFDRFVVVSNVDNSDDVDYTYPHDEETEVGVTNSYKDIVDIDGVKHENLDGALIRAKRTVNHPLRAQKARIDVNRIEKALHRRREM